MIRVSRIAALAALMLALGVLVVATGGPRSLSLRPPQSFSLGDGGGATRYQAYRFPLRERRFARRRGTTRRFAIAPESGAPRTLDKQVPEKPQTPADSVAEAEKRAEKAEPASPEAGTRQPSPETSAESEAKAVESADPAGGDDSKTIDLADLSWECSYDRAMVTAEAKGKMLLIYFHDPREDAACDAFEQYTLPHATVKPKLQNLVLAKLPRDTQVQVSGRKMPLLQHAAFREMLNRPGIVMIDFSNREREFYGRVVSTFPFRPGRYYPARSMAAMLDLPPGTLTQRTMIYAVRMHPEGPASTTGKLYPVLAAEAKSHSNYQASITLQGHHSWESRFHRINAKLPSGAMAQEVVAESWPNEGLVEACHDCVHSWRQSPGHWGAVRSWHPLFGYDIKRGRNGIWYATGIFGRR